jgi:hypothetical protein
MIRQSLTAENIFFISVFGNEMLTKLEKECYQFVLDSLIKNKFEKSNLDGGWSKDIQVAFCHFVQNDRYWSKQDPVLQTRFAVMSVVKISIYVELYFENFLRDHNTHTLPKYTGNLSDPDLGSNRRPRTSF